MALIAQEHNSPHALNLGVKLTEDNDNVARSPLFRYNVRCFIILLLKMQVGVDKGMLRWSKNTFF
jgi:hypothetical protein